MRRVTSMAEHTPAPWAELLKVAKAASHALRSYQYGNASSELAVSVADRLDGAIASAVSAHDPLVAALEKCRTTLDEIWFDKDASEENHLWVQDQKESIEMADAALALVRGDKEGTSR